MRRPTNPHSRFVRFAKIFFPLLALALLSTLFLFNRTIDPGDAIPFADIDVNQVAKDQVLRKPRFSAVTDDGSQIMVSADQAVADDNDSSALSASNIHADLTTPGGVNYRIVAQTGLYNGQGQMLDLTGEVSIETSDGYSLKTETISADLTQTGLTTTASIRGQSPSGNLEAGQMELSRIDGTQLLVFKSGVRLVYQPKD